MIVRICIIVLSYRYIVVRSEDTKQEVFDNLLAKREEQENLIHRFTVILRPDILTMKKLFGLLLIPVITFAQKKNEFILTGNLALSKPVDWIYVAYRTGDNVVNDSFQTKDGHFSYKGEVQEPALASVRIKYVQSDNEKAKRETIPLFLQPGKIGLTAKDSLQNNIVTGSKAHTDYLILAALQKPFGEKLNSLYEQYSAYYKAKDKEGIKSVEKRIDSIDALIKETVYHAFLNNNPKSPLGLFVLKQYAGYDIDADKVEPLFGALPAAIRTYPSYADYKELIEIAKKNGIGKYAMEFTQPDTLGNPVSLSSLKGKYVLIDFWASWCGPCRQENPNVVRVFNQYKDKGFTVLGVSLDRPDAKNRWLKAIHDDQLTWTHVSDLKFWENAVAVQYGIKAIPQNLLLDPQGKIIAKNLRGEELEQKLGNVFSAAQKTF